MYRSAAGLLFVFGLLSAVAGCVTRQKSFGIMQSTSALTEEAKQRCSGDPLVGRITAAKAQIGYDITDPRKGSGSVSVEDSKTIAQPLEDYQAAIEYVYQRSVSACVIYEFCKAMLYRSEFTSCADEQEFYNKSVDRADEMFLEFIGTRSGVSER